MCSIFRSFIAKLITSVLLAAAAPSLLAHEGHGAGSLAQHALEHGYMLLVPMLVISVIALTLRGRTKRVKNRID